MISEMSSSQATAIAEGQLDPSTMKGFKEFPSSNGQVKPTAFIKPSNAIQPSSRLLKQETTPTSCFTIVSIQKTGTKRITGKFLIQLCMMSIDIRLTMLLIIVMEVLTVMEQEPAFEKTKHKADLEEWRSLSNPSNLEKLISPLKNNILSKVGGIPAKRSSKVPDNNPFKRRKETVAVKDDCSVVTEIEDLETLGITPSSQKSVESKPVKKKK
ncbi:hypothetical protein Ccrd_017121, partial [Cynara cardunculus var. scolymus]